MEFRILKHKSDIYKLKFSSDFLQDSNKCFTFVKSIKNGIFCPISTTMDTKDRIKLIMEDQHMTQQVFADFLQQAPATLSSIFNGRTRPTLNIVDSIKKKIPDISIEWLLYGTGEMYISHPTSPSEENMETSGGVQNLMLNFDTPSAGSSNLHQNVPSGVNMQQGVRNTHLELTREELKMLEKEPRHVVEIRVYYDDQTFETFVPAKKQ